jgi:hypothetical protein
MQTNTTIPSKKPDIIIHDNEKRTCMSTEVAISGHTEKCDKKRSWEDCKT